MLPIWSAVIYYRFGLPRSGFLLSHLVTATPLTVVQNDDPHLPPIAVSVNAEIGVERRDALDADTSGLHFLARPG
jgi:hypothetical protein